MHLLIPYQINLLNLCDENGGQFVDVKIVDAFANSLRGELIRTEKEMNLRNIISPAQMKARTRRENELGVATFTP